ncbi:MAG: hypothetical protein ACTS6A_02775 [Candidatus Hodgkinia cicadicola]
MSLGPLPPLELPINPRRVGIVRLRLLPNQAKPLPPLSVTLGQRHIDIQQFCNRFNQLSFRPSTVPVTVHLRLHGGTSYDIIAKGPTVSQLVKDLLNVSKLLISSKSRISFSDVMRFAFTKAKDCNTSKLLGVAKSIVGTLTSMGIISITKSANN